jgi:uncharacterized BrkB/YihY/UPF0761 family membrane protein
MNGAVSLILQILLCQIFCQKSNKQGFLYFVASYLSRSNLVYGSFATITVFLTWAYFSSLIFMFGAHLNVQYQQLREKQG